MSNHTSGHNAEKAAAEYLRDQGYKILDLNWHTRYCEIDIVAQKAEVVYLIEVKFRTTAEHGSGLEYITPKKLKQMQFAAEMWASSKQWEGDYQLAAMGVDGATMSFVPID